ncbi:hypothetical protein ACOJUY_004334 [Vibrio alginolyticus]|nr:hypothetical protein [Vibrio parahaemolyticus]EHA1078678.1 hypothetical protein [Vibrio alginolyticus]EHA1137118.1 hypothetical protein [Vibrio alginolyticus]EJG1091292.1 hypothetical protein [Vibrio parahaemolyticus]MBM5100498.1 hypothetical protein [Vibrio parahaemolyticus]
MDNSNIIKLNFDLDQEPKQVFIENKSEPRHDECQHLRLSIDQSTNTVWCKDCNEKLDPMWVLNRIAEKHNQFYWNYSELYKKSKKAAEMNRCKCQHCNRMTKIIK